VFSIISVKFYYTFVKGI